MSLAGKIALITGGAGGLGKAFAAALLQAQAAAVCLVDISRNGREVASELNKKLSSSQVVDFYQCDITNYKLFQGAFDFVEKKYGGIDIVCNNAGLSAVDGDVEKSTQAFRVNLESVYFGTKLGMNYMDKDKGRGGGVIVNVASMAAFIPTAETMAYSSSKAGVVALTQSAAQPLNYEMYGVRVNCLCPSYTDTAMLDSVPGGRETVESIPNHAILEPSFVAQGFMQLVEDKSLNGAIMRVTPQKGIDFHSMRKKSRSRL